MMLCSFSLKTLYYSRFPHPLKSRKESFPKRRKFYFKYDFLLNCKHMHHILSLISGPRSPGVNPGGWGGGEWKEEILSRYPLVPSLQNGYMGRVQGVVASVTHGKDKTLH